MSAYRNLQELPGIGPSMARDLRDLGLHRPADLVGRDPQGLYDDLCRLRGQQLDRCVLYVFRCAVHNAATSPAAVDPEARKWWNWTDGGVAAESARRERARG